MINEAGRGSEDSIAEKYLEFAPNVILGGGSRFFDAKVRKDGKDMYAAFAAQGYGVARTKEELERSNALKLLGVFSNSHVPYEIDRRFQNVDAPSLAQMVRKGLPVLANSGERGFVLQIEAGRLDHAAHANDAAGVMWDILAGDEALGEVMAFVDRTPDTLLIVASDHGTGSGAMYGIGSGYLQTTAAFGLIDNHKASFEFMMSATGKEVSAQAIADTVAKYTGVKLSAKKRFRPSLATHNSQPADTLAWALAATNYDQPDRVNISYASGQHTATPTMFALYGKGAQSMRYGLIDNTELFHWMTNALRVRFQNPSMSEEQALRLLSERNPKAFVHPADTFALV